MPKSVISVDRSALLSRSWYEMASTCEWVADFEHVGAEMGRRDARRRALDAVPDQLPVGARPISDRSRRLPTTRPLAE